MNWRKNHRIVSLIILLPFSVVLLTGLLLQVRNKFEWIQPKTIEFQRLSDMKVLDSEEIIRKTGLDLREVSQVIFRPSKFNYSIRLNNHDEVQVHPQTGEVRQRKKRWTSFLIDLHQGSFFTGLSQDFIFLPTGLGVLFLVISGMVIFPRRKKYEK